MSHHSEGRGWPSQQMKPQVHNRNMNCVWSPEHIEGKIMELDAHGEMKEKNER